MLLSFPLSLVMDIFPLWISIKLLFAWKLYISDFISVLLTMSLKSFLWIEFGLLKYEKFFKSKKVKLTCFFVNDLTRLIPIAIFSASNIVLLFVSLTTISSKLKPGDIRSLSESTILYSIIKSSLKYLLATKIIFSGL